MTREYDVVVIGTGTAGSSVAFACSCAGMSVAIADYRTFGGTCALRGCVPKKVLHAAAEVVEASRRLSGKGISGEVGIAWPDLMEHKRSFTDPVAENREIAYADAGIEMYHGFARFTGPNTLSVGEEEVSGRHIVIAAGSVPRRLNIPGEEHLATSDYFLDMPSLPGHIVFAGGGYISFELAHIAARAGAEATILHRSSRMLRQFDPDLVDLLVEESGRAGIRIHTEMPLHSIEKTADGFLVRAGRSGEHSFMADLVVHGAGTVPETGHLNLEAGGIEADSRGIVVDEYLRSASNRSVYVVGDANPESIQLLPVADVDADAVARSIIEGELIQPDHSVVPSAIFTIPPLAGVGLTPKEANEKGIRYILHSGDSSSWLSSKRIGLAHSGYTVLVDGDTGAILGAHLFGYHADEAINIFALAMKAGITADDLRAMIWTYPTAVYDIGYMVD